MNQGDFPHVIDDIGCWIYSKRRDQTIYSLGSKTIDRYLRVEEEKLDSIMTAINFMDGQHSLIWIEDYLLTCKQTAVDMRALSSRLEDLGLLQGSRAEKMASEISVMGVELFKIDFPTVSSKCAGIISSIWRMCIWFSILLTVTGLSGMMLNRVKLMDLLNYTYVFKGSYALGGLLAVLLSFLNLILHELAHWATAIRYGLQPSKFHMSLYCGVLPIWYVKIRGMYTLDAKKRIAITAAGLYMHWILAMVAVAILLWGSPPLTVIEILTKLMVSNLFNIILTLSPFKLTDGYYIASWITGVSNLRMKTLQAIKNLINGKREAWNGLLISYFIIGLAAMLISLYFTFDWNVKIYIEISSYFDYYPIKIMIIFIPFIILGTAFYKFVKQFMEYIKQA